MAYEFSNIASNDFSTIMGTTHAMATPQPYKLSNQTGYDSGKEFLNGNRNTNIYVPTSSVITSGYGALAGISNNKTLQLSRNTDNPQTDPSNSYFSFSTIGNTR